MSNSYPDYKSNKLTVPVTQPAQQEPKKDMMYSTVAMQERHAAFVDRAVATLEQAKREALAEQPAQQEPGVAVFELQESGWEIICDGDWIQTLPLRTKLYTSPQPAQPSNPLTDEQIARVLAQLPVPPTCDGSSLHDWAIQAVRVLDKNQ